MKKQTPQQQIDAYMRKAIRAVVEAVNSEGGLSRPLTYSEARKTIRNMAIDQLRYVEKETSIRKLADALDLRAFKLQMLYFQLPITPKLRAKVAEISSFRNLKSEEKIDIT
jgi:hypothetical protein